MPVRIQRKRTKGWKMPPNTVYVGRPTIWGNPYTFGQAVQFKPGVNTVLITAVGLVLAYRGYLKRMLDAQPGISLEQLRGKNLACWCPLDQPCHADVLLEIANGTEPSRAGTHATIVL